MPTLISVPAHIATEILNPPFAFAEIRPRGDVTAALKAANTNLSNSTVMGAAASHVAAEARKRGNATLLINADGTLYVQVTSRGRSTQADAPRRTRRSRNTAGDTTGDASVSQTRRSTLPKIEELRTRAIALGIDPAPFGIGRKALLEAIQIKEGTNVTPPPTPAPLTPPAGSQPTNGVTDEIEASVDELLGLTESA